MKLLSVVGARPQFVKAAVLSRLLLEQAEFQSIQELLVHTGQHFDAQMSDVFFEEMAIPEPKYHLGIGGGQHGAMTGRMMEALESVYLRENPDWVLVYGDTNSTLAAALAAVKLHIPVAHVEAGMRCFDKRQPEEVNRILADHCAQLLFTTSAVATRNLLREGISAEAIIEVGDIMYDAALFYRERLSESSPSPTEYALATLHRAENTDDPEQLKRLFDGLAGLSTSIQVLMPLHPRTRKRLEELHLLEFYSQTIRFLPPQGYLDMVRLETGASLILTDSGGVQREAHYFHVPCVVLRDRTEWEELVTDAGHRLASTPDAIIQAGLSLLAHASPEGCCLYGDGHAAERIARSLLERSQVEV
ncbi:MAG: UDP-N-acetylglucosamine 2-epimerase (non-hydrolyzing) [Chlamydiia bacterium]|nr:UDP-N-acetylglucosamine 2-epimerase (non-hydrolyzing) [Chlamydiia bacterium]